MRGTDEKSGSLFSYVELEDRIPAKHPLRKIQQVVNEALASLGAEFDALYVDFGRPFYCAGAADPGEPDPDPVFGPLRTAIDGTDAV